MSPTANDPVAIVGASGALGFGLAVRLGPAGVPIVIGSRDADRAAEESAERALALVPGGSFSGGDNADAVGAANTVILSVPFRNQSETLANLQEALAPGTAADRRDRPARRRRRPARHAHARGLAGLRRPAGREMAPDGRARRLGAAHRQRRLARRPRSSARARTCCCAVTHRADKRHAALLIERIAGLRCVDCGKLEMARITESLTALLISVNARYKTHAGHQAHGPA